MNKVCAAGTGSFLEEQAEKLGISIVEEFGELALGAQTARRRSGDRCTVFMESDLNSHQQKGAAKEDLVGGPGLLDRAQLPPEGGRGPSGSASTSSSRAG